MNKTIKFTSNKLKQLKIVYEKAIENKKETFIFEKNEYLVGYAKYLIEYLENQFLNK
jgi:hypothetical protein